MDRGFIRCASIFREEIITEHIRILRARNVVIVMRTDRRVMEIMEDYVEGISV